MSDTIKCDVCDHVNKIGVAIALNCDNCNAIIYIDEDTREPKEPVEVAPS